MKYPGFEKATREVLKALDVELSDLPFSCCPAPTQMKLAHFDSWLALAARNLCLAEEAGVNRLIHLQRLREYPQGGQSGLEE